MLNLNDFEQRGRSGYYYRRTAPKSRPGTAYVLATCDNCHRSCLVQANRPFSRRFCSADCRQADTRGRNWAGDEVGYKAAHHRVYRIRGKASSCVWGCPATRYEWANLTGNLLDPDDYASMCCRCHTRFDAAIRVTETRPARWRWEPWRGVAPSGTSSP